MFPSFHARSSTVLFPSHREFYGELLMRRFLVSIAVFCGMACGEPTGLDAVAGTYTLQTIDGENSPWFSSTTTRIDGVDDEQVFVETTTELVGSTMELDSDATFSVSDEYRVTEVVTDATGITLAPTVTFENSTTPGTYTLTGASILLTTSAGTDLTASLSGDVLTTTVNGVLWVWER